MSSERRLGVYICQCGTNIAGKVDTQRLADFALQLPHVAQAAVSRFLCSVPGQELIAKDIEQHQLDGVVVASCSPRLHEATFRRVLNRAGLNPYLLAIANIRENCAWMVEEPEAALERARLHVKAQVLRAKLLRPLDTQRAPINPKTLVIGGGIAGIEAALRIADAGQQVYLVERQPSIGGRMAQFDKTFPTMDCAACILTPKMVSAAQHPNIQLMVASEVTAVDGYVGNFQAMISRRPTYVDDQRCTGCGECAKVCPSTVPDEFDAGLRQRSAIYRSFPQAVPNSFVIDKTGLSPCRAACPAGVNAHGYARLVAAGRYREAFALLSEKIVLAGSLGRICPAPCESACTRSDGGGALRLRGLKRFIADWYYEHHGAAPPAGPPAAPRSERVAIVGGGPSGLACAYYLARAGVGVTVFESSDRPGGLLRQALPEYRLPQAVLDQDLAFLSAAGVAFRCGTTVGPQGTSLDDLLGERYQACYLALGAGRDRPLGLPGESATGVTGAVSFLYEAKRGTGPDLSGKSVSVIGGGNTAIDAARTARRLGAQQVTILYRRRREDMPAIAEEIVAAEAEGVRVQCLVSPTAFLTEEETVRAVQCVTNDLGPVDASNRPRPVPQPDSTHEYPARTVLVATGQAGGALFWSVEGIECDERGRIKADSTGQTSRKGVYAGGDVVGGPSSVVEAIQAGRQAARAIEASLSTKGEARPPSPPALPALDGHAVAAKLRPQPLPAVSLTEMPAEQRVTTFGEVNQGLDEQVARQEADRCLDCGGCSECGLCVTACEAQAIDPDHQPLRAQVEVGTIIVATGLDLASPREKHLKRYGYGRLPEVYTNLEFERLNNANGPTGGEIRTRHGRRPQAVAIVHCVGSRDIRHRRYCSRVCCMSSLKFARLIREKTGAEVFNFYIDVRASGKNHEEFYEHARRDGVHFIRGRVAEVTDQALVPEEVGQLVVVAENTLIQRIVRVPVDMVILSLGLEPAAGSAELAHALRLSQGHDGFFMETHPKIAPVSTFTSGVFLAGGAHGPKDIGEAVTQAGAAAGQALALTLAGTIELDPLVSSVDQQRCAGCRTCLALCPYGAISLGPETGLAVVNEIICKGCGTCVAGCPSSASHQNMFEDDQLLAEIRGVLS
jgi:heterodisulfide reductase subunit A